MQAAEWYLEACEPEAISATSLAEEMRDNPEVVFECYRLKSDSIAEVGCLIFAGDLFRAGIACGGNAEWTDCSSAEDALRRWVSNEMVN